MSVDNDDNHDEKKSRSHDEDYFRQVDTTQCVNDVLKLDGIYALVEESVDSSDRERENRRRPDTTKAIFSPTIRRNADLVQHSSTKSNERCERSARMRDRGSEMKTEKIRCIETEQ